MLPEDDKPRLAVPDPVQAAAVMKIDRAAWAVSTYAKYDRAAVMRIAPTMTKDRIIIVNLCGRGDKDIFTVAEALDVKL